MSAPSTDDLPRLGRYQVINKIAAGGMAEVFLAKAVGAMGFQRLVAVKLIHANFTRDEEFVKMFIDEARIAMHLHHRNIVQVFDLDRANDTYFIAMEFVHGVNLYDLYERIAGKRRWIEPPMALYIIAEVSKGLHFAHTRRGADGRPLGIVHRDISPQNVLLSFEGEVKITDFGIATAAERLHQTAAGIVKGKYAYMAPERLQEKPTDGRVDVFSAGVLLYEMLVGENPFAGTSAVDTIENVLHKKIPPPSERGAPISTSLDRIVMKALARNPAERFATAQDLADAVTDYALELTQARRDMASGDATLATLLAELFPEKSKRPPIAADPKSFNLPGVGSGVAVATLDETDKPTGPRPPAPKKNGRIPELEVTQDDEQTRDDPPALRDPADSGDSDEPTVLRMPPISDSDALAAVQAQQHATANDDFTTREDLSFPEGLLPARSTPRNAPSLPTPVTPYSSGDIEKTAPTELPSMIPPVRKPIVASISRGGSGSPDPAAPNDDGEDMYAATLQSASGLDTMPDEDTPGMPPVIVPPIVVPTAGPPQVGRAQGAASVPGRDAVRVSPYVPSSQSHAPSSSVGGLSAGPAPHVPVGARPMLAPSQSYVPVSSSSHDMQLVVPVSSPDLQSQSASFPAGRVAIPARSSTIIAVLLLVIAGLVVLAAVLVVRNREPTVLTAPVAVKVTSAPPGASVSIDGSPSRGVTPFDTAMLSGEVHRFSVTLDGYKEQVQEQQIHAPMEGGNLVVHFQLESLGPSTGSITVLATPPEARVLIDGQDRGSGSVTVGSLPLGKQITVRVEAPGYKPIEQQLTLDRDAAEVTMPIVLAKGKTGPTGQVTPPPGQPAGGSARPTIEAVKQRRVQLTTDYGTWANVYFNRKWLGTTPLFETLPVGDVQLRVVNEAMKLDKVITVTIPETGPEQVVLTLR